MGGQAKLIQQYFKAQFTDNTDPPLPAFDGLPKPLSVPISDVEVATATAKLKNGKANGPDNIPNEILKAWHPECNSIYAEILNASSI